MTFRGSLPPGQVYRGQQPRPHQQQQQQQQPQQQQPYGQGQYPQMYVQPAQTLSQFPDGRSTYSPSSMGPVSQPQPQHAANMASYYGGNMMAVNGNMNGMAGAPSPTGFPGMYGHGQQQPQHQSGGHGMQSGYDRPEQASAHLPSPRMPPTSAYQQAQATGHGPRQGQPQHYGGHYPQNQQMHQQLQYVPSPSPAATTPNTNMNMGTNMNSPLTAAATPSPAAYPYAEQARPQPSPKTTVAHSPALSARSSIISKRSPSMSTKAVVSDPVAVMMCVAEECLATARGNLQDVVSSSTGQAIQQYQRLIATALSCFEAALQQSRLTPRQEAKIRLRYASVLYEDTENVMEAETALSSGIKLCDKHRFMDLKYSMVYLQTKLLLSRGHAKAATVAVERQINELSSRTPHWIYAFRFLKATFFLHSKSPADGPAMENLRAITTLAKSRGDRAIEAFSSLLEGLALLKTTKEDALERVQDCIARASKYQLDPLLKIPQLDILVLLLDLGSSMRQKNPTVMWQKLMALQTRLDATDDWTSTSPTLQLPIKKLSSPQHISEDTASVIRPGAADDSHDYLVLSYVAKAELFILVMTLSGLIAAFRTSSTPQKSLVYFNEALETLERWNKEKRTSTTEPLPSLQDAVSRARWRSDLHCYLHVLSGLEAATHSKWRQVKESVDRLHVMTSASPGSVIELLGLYLTGVYHQGTGDLEEAISIFQDDRFEIPDLAQRQRCPRLDVSLLAAMNVLWIMEHPDYKDVSESSRIMERIKPLCHDHPDMQVRTAFNLIFATATLHPKPTLQEVKQSMSGALNLSRVSGNTHCLAIALNIMRCKLFEGVVGEQALKSAKAAALQAKKCGNLLWMSVADGMLAHSHDVQGQLSEALSAHATGTSYALKALTGEDD